MSLSWAKTSQKTFHNSIYWASWNRSTWYALRSPRHFLGRPRRRHPSADSHCVVTFAQWLLSMRLTWTTQSYFSFAVFLPTANNYHHNNVIQNRHHCDPTARYNPATGPTSPEAPDAPTRRPATWNMKSQTLLKILSGQAWPYNTEKLIPLQTVIDRYLQWSKDVFGYVLVRLFIYVMLKIWGCFVF